MHATTAQVRETVRVAVAGELDAAAAPRLQAALLAAAASATMVIVDLREVTVLGADALQVLVEVRGRLLRNGRRFRVSGMSRPALVAFARAGVRWVRLTPPLPVAS